ncbi:aquaporin-like protein [Crassisporium funariophilum]|nr:aquaporin-like protein [Crassisporium funariophilum]
MERSLSDISAPPVHLYYHKMSTPLLRDVMKRPAVFAAWEKRRNSKQVHWAIECFAEMMGVFFYVYFGVGSTAGWVIGNIIKQPGLSSLLQIGLGYAFGIMFAIGVCSSTSGGHFNPCVTIAFCIFRKFPKWKALRYIVAQILGAYIASALVYNQWKVLIDEAEALLLEAGPAVFAATQFTPNGPPGIFALYLLPGQTIPRVLLNEFVNCTLLAMIIWASLDPTNFLIPPVMGPFVISIAYAAAIWGFATPGISLNAARDIGARLFAMTIWGLPASGGRYAAIAALVNIPGTLLAACIYEVFLTDSDRVVSASHLQFMDHNANHGRLQPYGDHPHHTHKGDSDTSSQEKANITTLEHSGARV